MKNLVKVINLVIRKYLNDITLIIEKDKLILEFMYVLANGEEDIYKIMELTEADDKLRILYKPENYIEDTEFEKIEQIFEQIKNEIIKKYDLMNLYE